MTYSKHVAILTSGLIASIVLFSTGAIASSVTTDSHQSSHQSSYRPSGDRSSITHSTVDAILVQASNNGFNGQGRPQSRSSGGARGSCSDQLIALLPGPEPIPDSADACSLPSEAYATQTITPTPTLWFYVPSRQQSVEAELVLLDQNQQAISVETVTLPPASGIVGVQIGSPLEVNQAYRWVFSLLESNSPSLNRSVEGTIQRVELAANLAQQLEAEPAGRDRLALLTQQGIWQDALTELIAMRQDAPNDATVTQTWEQFLNSAGLLPIVNAPVLD